MYLEIFTIYLIIELFAYIILHSAKFKKIDTNILKDIYHLIQIIDML